MTLRHGCVIMCALLTLYAFSLQAAAHSSKHPFAPPYIQYDDALPVMQFGVVNQSKSIDQELLERVLKTCLKQVERDFSPYYGIIFDYEFIDNMEDVNWKDYVPLIITDYLVHDLDVLGFHYTEDFSGTFHAPISYYLYNPPDLPNGAPYAVIVMGSPETDYGIIPAFLRNSPTLPPTFESIFCFVVSHEILETLHNYGVDKFYYFWNVVDGYIDYYTGEVCDPVEFTPGYIINCLFVSNFVLPSFWVQNLTIGPFDFLDTVPGPFTPFAGQLTYIHTSDAGSQNYTLYSSPYDPEVLIRIPGRVIFD